MSFRKRAPFLLPSPDDVHGLVDYVGLVYSNDSPCPCLGGKEREYARPTANVQHNLVSEERRVFLDKKLVRFSACFILREQYSLNIKAKSTGRNILLVRGSSPEC